MHIGYAALQATVGNLKQLLVDKANIPQDRQRIIYKGRVLDNDQQLQAHGRFQINCSVTLYTRPGDICSRHCRSARRAHTAFGRKGTNCAFPCSRAGTPITRSRYVTACAQQLHALKRHSKIRLEAKS
jgi:hypothetical protein